MAWGGLTVMGGGWRGLIQSKLICIFNWKLNLY